MNHRTEKTIITVETFQRTFVRSGRNAKITWCERCAAEKVKLAPEEAADAGEIHCLESKAGELLVCGHSSSSHLRLRTD